MFGDFAKVDNSTGLSFDEVIDQAQKILDSDDASFDSLMDTLLEVANAIVPKELDGYYPGRIQVGELCYLVKEGTFRTLAALGQVFFEQETFSSADEPIYVTVSMNAITAVVWYPMTNPAEELDAALRAA